MRISVRLCVSADRLHVCLYMSQDTNSAPPGEDQLPTPPHTTSRALPAAGNAPKSFLGVPALHASLTRESSAG